jgi:hypothetical protein
MPKAPTITTTATASVPLDTSTRRRRTRNSDKQLSESLQVLETLLVEHDYTAAIITVQERKLLNQGLQLVYERTQSVDQFIREVLLVPEVDLSSWEHKTRYLSLVEQGVFEEMEMRWMLKSTLA